MVMNPVIFREYDIRGVVGKDFDEDFAYQLARAYVSFIKDEGIEQPIVTVGHDARISSPSLAESVIKGFVDSGARVYRLGLITTPISYFSTFAIPRVNGAIMVTGSHNPPDQNGFKISVGKSTIFGKKIQTLREIIEQKRFIQGIGAIKKHNILPAYLKRYSEEFSGIKPISVVIDCGNGAAGCITRQLYSAVGLNPIILFEEPDGNFPNHHPDPTVEKNLKDLISKVKETKADVGIGFDGDADRIGVVDNEGHMISGDELMVVIGRDILQHNSGATIIGDVKCSDRLFQDLASVGGRPIMWQTGHSLIKEKVKIEKAPFGGELSGHFFFSDRNYGFDDALYAGLRLIEILSKTGKRLSDLLSHLPKAYNTPEIRIDTSEEKKHLVVQALRDRFSKPSTEYTCNLIDGIRVSFKDGWALARASNTQPVLVMRFESSSQEGLKRIQDDFEAFIKPILLL